MADIIRHKALPRKSFGACERCGSRPSIFYAITPASFAERVGEFVCGVCVPATSTELNHHSDIFEEATGWRF